MMPPACERPCAVCGESAQRSNMPEHRQRQRRRADQDPARASAARAPGAACARRRRPAASGNSTAPLPISRAADRGRSTRPIGPAAWNQTAMAQMIPKASTPSPAPSRRCSGSSSRAVAALRPPSGPPTDRATRRQMRGTRAPSRTDGSAVPAGARARWHGDPAGRAPRGLAPARGGRGYEFPMLQPPVNPNAALDGYRGRSDAGVGAGAAHRARRRRDPRAGG